MGNGVTKSRGEVATHGGAARDDGGTMRRVQVSSATSRQGAKMCVRRTVVQVKVRARRARMRMQRPRPRTHPSPGLTSHPNRFASRHMALNQNAAPAHPTAAPVSPSSRCRDAIGMQPSSRWPAGRGVRHYIHDYLRSEGVARNSSIADALLPMFVKSSRVPGAGCGRPTGGHDELLGASRAHASVGRRECDEDAMRVELRPAHASAREKRPPQPVAHLPTR